MGPGSRTGTERTTACAPEPSDRASGADAAPAGAEPEAWAWGIPRSDEPLELFVKLKWIGMVRAELKTSKRPKPVGADVYSELVVLAKYA